MQRTSIANTGIQVSIIGLGTVKFGRNVGVKYPSPFTIPDDSQALDLLDAAWDCGINFLDTAPAYGNSEERLGQLLAHSKREWIIATKAGESFDASTGESSYNFSPEFIQQSIESSLRNLQRDVLDIVFIHSNGEDKKIILQDGALQVLDHLKQKGWLRAIGMSTKTVEGGLLAVDNSDVVMVTHNLSYQKEKSVIDAAYEKKTGIVIKKALASGHSTLDNASIDDPISASFNEVFSNKGVCSIILGTINSQHIVENSQKAEASYRLQS